MTDASAHVSEMATDQGSESANVVLDNYLSESEKRNLRRRFMRQRLESAFESGD
jgi:hypothetical protein